jgi:hypothetical protein
MRGCEDERGVVVDLCASAPGLSPLEGYAVKRSIRILVAVAVTLMAGEAGAAGKEPLYVGVKKCRTCHKKELIGDQYREWESGYHARSVETLKTDKALEFAKERDVSGPPHEAKECLKCHVTGYGEDLAHFSKGKALATKDGIQCESCHGPGSNYRKKKIMSDRDKSLAAGMWEPGKDEKICTACHNDTSPSWEAAKGFDYEAAKKKIAHPIPEDVKGKFIELEKKQKAERKARGEVVDDEEEED